MKTSRTSLVLFLSVLGLSGAFVLSTMSAWADEAEIAVAANFTAPMQKIVEAFGKSSGHQIKLSFGSTGKFAAQIRNGAPFDALLAADDITPKKLEDEGLAVKGQRYTYAMGQLVLLGAHADVANGGAQALKESKFKHLAVADPKLAPYGAAGMQTLQSLGLLRATLHKIVMGDNISQTYQFVKTGNADLGFVALSQVIQTADDQGHYWIVPQKYYRPIRQDAALLTRGATNKAAIDLLAWLRGKEGQTVIHSYGYALP